MANAEGVANIEQEMEGEEVNRDEPMLPAPQPGGACNLLVKPIFGYINRWTEWDSRQEGKVTLPPRASVLVYVGHCAELPAPKYEFTVKEYIEGIPQKNVWRYNVPLHVELELEKKRNNAAWGYEVSIKIDVIVNSMFYQTYLSNDNDHSLYRRIFCIHYCNAISAKYDILLNAEEALYCTYIGSERTIATMNRKAKPILIRKKFDPPLKEKEIQKIVKNNKTKVQKNRPEMQALGIKEFGKVTITRFERNLKISFPVEYEGMDFNGLFSLNIKVNRNMVSLVSDDGAEVFSVTFQFRFDEKGNRMVYDKENNIITLSVMIKI
ncbi:hypothetical protein GCK72_025337 [Caenorhabditis remanei]|uniref:Uncharacterized protein n=1 Tax=Caenorhabditis remanei TaxID=31234 RepID=A0A6A5G1N3_CAERE|nr:hypothetical protein GCK72_025337 [Caenorhabditis remanei]KAF1748870.1 hypothetical protein GCK72_025337 [Caenorhabditis remanei]